MQYLDKTGLARLWNNIKSKLTGKEDKSNKVTSITSSSTDIQYPSAKAVKEYVDKKQTYSTDEIVVGTWIDGKPIYRKVINFGSLPNANFKNVAHGIENFEDMTKIIAIGKTTDGKCYPIPLVGNGSVFSGATATMRVDATNIIIATTTNISSHTSIVILEYTKTTD